MAELIEFEYAERAVPDDGAGVTHDFAQHLCRDGANVKNHVVGQHIFDTLGDSGCIRRKLLAANNIGRNRHGSPACRHDVDDLFRFIDEIGFGQRFANRQTHRQQKCIGDAATDHQLIDFLRERF